MDLISMWKLKDFYKEGLFYRGPENEWEFAIYNFHPRGLGDLIYNTLRVIIETNDKSEWAYNSLLECADLLWNGKRWTDEMNPVHVDYTIAYRSQFSMTRDPWVMFYACAIHLNRKQFIEMKPPCRLYRPELWSLRRALLGKFNLFKLWQWMTPASKDYVKALDRFMAWAYDNKNINN